MTGETSPARATGVPAAGTRDDRWIHRADVWSGLVLGSALATRTFRPSLMPRTTAHQGLVSGASGAIGFGLAQAVYGLGARTGSTATDALLLAGVSAGGFAVSRLVGEPATDPAQEPAWRPVVRTAGSALAAGGAAATAGAVVRAAPPQRRVLVGGALAAAAGLGGAREVVRGVRAQRAAHAEYDPPPPAPLPAVATSVAVAGTLAAVGTGLRRTSAMLRATLERRLGVPPPASRWAARLGTVALWGGSAKGVANLFVSLVRTYDRVVDTGFDRAPTSPSRSSGPGSPIAFARLGREGRRFVLNVPGTDDIAAVMGTPAVAEPVRVFVGYSAARTDEERVALAMGELRRTGAFDRRLLVVGCPAGNGYVNTLALEVLDHLLLGDTAAVAVAYGRLPSFLTLNRVSRGGRVHRGLLDAIARELAARPPGERPRVVVYGESLGAWSGQDAFLHDGLDGLDACGVERALWVGTPYYSGWRREVLLDRTHPAPAGAVVEVTRARDLEALDDLARAGLRVVILGHGNDPVRYLCAGLLVRRPDWLRGTRPWGVPEQMGWLPAVTAVQVIVDAVNATRPVPGVFRATGHEYSADLPLATAVAYGIDRPPAAVWDRLVQHLAATDAARARRRHLPRIDLDTGLPSPAA